MISNNEEIGIFIELISNGNDENEDDDFKLSLHWKFKNKLNDILYKFTTYENIDKEYEGGAVCFVAVAPINLGFFNCM